jgi:hypothetical protein
MPLQKYHLTPFTLLLAFMLVAGSWLFFRSSIHTGTILLLGCLPSLLWIPAVWLLTRYRWPHISFPVSKRFFWGFWLSILIFMGLFPLYTYYTVGPEIDRSLARIGIQAKLLERDIYLLDELSDVGDVKRVFATYEIQEPLETAVEKLRLVTIREPTWKVWPLSSTRHDGTKKVIDIGCEPSHSIGLYEDGVLIVIYRYTASYVTGCLLP